MAEINVGINKTNDPSYLGNSQGTDRASLQPLATVPDLSTKYVQPDYQVNKTAGSAAKGVGDLSEAAVKLTDAIIQRKADDTLTEGINKIRDEFGVSAASQMGQADNEKRVSLQADTAATPAAVNRLGNRLEGLTEQYNQGGLSNSAYFAKLEAFVRQTKTQFPGYSNEIDSMVATKVGTTPANALRSSLLDDVTKLQSKVTAAQDKRTTWEHSNMAAIQEAYGSKYWSDPKPPMQEVEAKVATIQAREADVVAQRARLGLKSEFNASKSDEATDFGTRVASNLSQKSVVGLTNEMGIKSTDDLKDYLDSVRNGTRAAPTADEQQALKGVFSAIKAKITNAYHTEMNTPISPSDTRTPASIQRNPTAYKAGLDIALSNISTIEDGLLNEKHGIVGFTVAYNKAAVDDATRKLVTAHPDAATIAAIPKLWGDNALSTLFTSSNPAVLSSTMTVLRASGLSTLAKGEPAIEYFKTASKDDPSGVANSEYIKAANHAIQNPESIPDKSVVDGSFKSLYGAGNTTFFDAWRNQPSSQTQVFGDIYSEKTTKAVAKRSATDQLTYTQSAEKAFTSVFQGQMSGVNQYYNDAAKNGRIELSYNPKSEQFEYVPKKLSMTEKLQENISGKPAGLPIGAANASLAELNSAFNTMKPVLKLEGKSMTDFMRQALPQMQLPNNSSLLAAFQKATQTEEPK